MSDSIKYPVIAATPSQILSYAYVFEDKVLEVNKSCGCTKVNTQGNSINYTIDVGSNESSMKAVVINVLLANSKRKTIYHYFTVKKNQFKGNTSLDNYLDEHDQDIIN